MPKPDVNGPRHGQITWKEPDLSDVIRLLHNPTYAGAYVYGQKEYDSFDRSPTNGKARVHPRPLVSAPCAGMPIGIVRPMPDIRKRPWQVRSVSRWPVPASTEAP